MLNPKDMENKNTSNQTEPLTPLETDIANFHSLSGELAHCRGRFYSFQRSTELVIQHLVDHHKGTLPARLVAETRNRLTHMRAQMDTADQLQKEAAKLMDSYAFEFEEFKEDVQEIGQEWRLNCVRETLPLVGNILKDISKNLTEVEEALEKLRYLARRLEVQKFLTEFTKTLPK